MIQNFVPWVYEEQELFEYYLQGNLTKGDVVVTHHLPAPGSIDPIWENSLSNCYFLCDMTSLIKTREPALFLHGHTHNDADYTLGDTRVVCHPRGYPKERNRGPQGYLPKLIEIP
jgi:Icc-related predicted phosphoesterase